MQGFEVESARNGLGIHIRSQDNVGDVAVLRAGRCGVRIPGVTRSPSPPKIQPGRPPIQWVLGALSLWVKKPGA
jgi:hypothetical protein